MHHSFYFFLLLLFSTAIPLSLAAIGDLVGCFQREENAERQNHIHTVTVRGCLQACQDVLYRYAVLEPSVCRCSNDRGRHETGSDQCLPCPVDPANLCGGHDTQAFYDTGVSGAVEQLRVRQTTNTSIFLAWNRPRTALKITKYVVEAAVLETFSSAMIASRSWSLQENVTDYECTSLQPGSTYNITVTAFSGFDVSGNASIVAKTKIGIPDPPPDEPKILSESDTTRTIEIRPVYNQNGPVTNYRVVVQFLDSDIDQGFDESLLTNYSQSMENGIPYYIAAELENRTQTFTVGDGRNYLGYDNPPLPSGQHVHISIGVVSKLGGDPPQYRYATTSHAQHREEKIGFEPPLVDEVDTNGTNQTLMIILIAGCIIFGLLLIGSSIAYCVLRFRSGRRRQRLSEHHELTPQTPISEIENNGFISDAEFRNFPEQVALLIEQLDETQRLSRKNLTLDIDQVLASGRYGDTIRGSLSSNNISHPCRVDVVTDDMEKADQLAFVRELKQLLEINGHESFLHFFGICRTPDWIYLVFEDVTKSLKKCLLDARLTPQMNAARFSAFPEETILNIISDVCTALEYLTLNKIIHKRLCCYNVRVSQDSEIKLGFFGPVPFEETTGKQVDLARWQAPEVLKNQNYSAKSDVWSFGLLIWEVCCLGATPYGNIGSGDLLARIRNGARPEQPPFIYDDLYQTCLNCWELEAPDRPTFAEVSQYLKQLQNSAHHVLSFTRRDGISLPFHQPLLEIKN